MTKGEKSVVVVLIIIALLIVGYNSFIRAKTSGKNVELTVDRSYELGLESTEVDEALLYDEEDEHEEIVNKMNQEGVLDYDDYIIDVYD